MSPFSPGRFAAMFLTLVGCGMSLAAPVPTTAKVESKAAKARAALDQKVTLKAENKSFNEVIEMFHEATKVDFVLDQGALQLVGMSADQPLVKFDAKDTTVRDALKQAFGKYNLKIGVTASGIAVSSDEGLIARQFRQRVNIDAEGKPLVAVVKMLADDTGANLLVDPRAFKKGEEPTVTAKLDDVPLETAVRVVAELSGVRVVRMSNVLLLTNDDRAEKLKNDADKPVQPTPLNPVFPPEFGGPFPPGVGGAVPGVPGDVVPQPEIVPAVLKPVPAATDAPKEKK